MAYATVDELAEALRIKVSAGNTDFLEACLDAAAEEIDYSLDRVDPLPDPPPVMVVRTNVNRAVEWFKAADAAFGIVGYADTGQLRTPKDGFARHAATIRAEKQRFGVG